MNCSTTTDNMQERTVCIWKWRSKGLATMVLCCQARENVNKVREWIKGQTHREAGQIICRRIVCTWRQRSKGIATVALYRWAGKSVNKAREWIKGQMHNCTAFENVCLTNEREICVIVLSNQLVDIMFFSADWRVVWHWCTLMQRRVEEHTLATEVALY